MFCGTIVTEMFFKNINLNAYCLFNQLIYSELIANKTKNTIVH